MATCPLAAPHPSQGGASARLAYHVAAGFPAHAVSQWRSEERQLEEEEEEEYLSSMICFIKGKLTLDSLKVRAARSLEKGCVGAEQEEERAREQRSKGAKPGDAGLSGDGSRNEGVFEQRERRKILETEGDAPPVNNNGVICFQEENTFDTDRCGYCEALLAFTLHPLRPPVITSPFQRRHYCDGYAAFEGSSSRPSLGRTRLTLAAL
ncbi:hypothetical protein O3P69_020916, partial [Scylla paramamosain]